MSQHALHHALGGKADHGKAAQQPDQAGSGFAQVEALARQGRASATPPRIAAVIEAHPGERDRILHFCQTQFGNAFTQHVVQHATQDAKQADAKEPADDGGIHIITDAGLRHLRQSGPAGIKAAKELYDNPNAYIVLKAGQHMPDGWKGKATLLYPSFRAFHDAAKHGKIGKGVDAVVYDNEHWEQTPPDEKRNAAEFAKKFEQLAHSMGLTFIAAPTQKWFAADARYADIIDVQLQDRESHVGSYGKALEHDVHVAHRENKDVQVTAQITSSVRHLDPTHSGRGHQGIEKAETDILRNADDIDGFWGYVYQQNQPSIDAGTTILKDLAKDKRKGAKI